jgi:LPS sulfotransferase NodH
VLTPEAYLDRVRDETYRPGRGGTKIHLYQLQVARRLRIANGLRDLFPAAPGVHQLLRTRRRDVVGQAVSGHIADATRVYCHWADKEPEISPGYEGATVLQPEYDFPAITARCLEIVEHEIVWDAEIAASGLPCETFWYEELATEYEAAMRRAMTAVGLAPDVPVPAPQLIRQADARNEEFVRRFHRDAHAEGLDVQALA